MAPALAELVVAGGELSPRGVEILHKVQDVPKNRIETFSDAVMAIIVTLLVLDLRPPELDGHTTSNEFLQAMTPLASHFFSFALSFTMVAIYWVNHYYFFRRIKRVTGRLIWLNNVLLFWLCLLPFPGSLRCRDAAGHGGDEVVGAAVRASGGAGDVGLAVGAVVADRG
ncbi:TMEM175 family protein, partial [Micromonospora sicca]|uniref:TMEM175 family protein n=1 Tax=Micromonospora sicca TaxID=2202420 RepID=UPI0011B78879